jgi:hypothetical protein
MRTSNIYFSKDCEQKKKYPKDALNPNHQNQQGNRDGQKTIRGSQYHTLISHVMWRADCVTRPWRFCGDTVVSIRVKESSLS